MHNNNSSIPKALNEDTFIVEQLYIYIQAVVQTSAWEWDQQNETNNIYCICMTHIYWGMVKALDETWTGETVPAISGDCDSCVLLYTAWCNKTFFIRSAN